MPVTFPDGSTAEVTWEDSFPFDGLNVVPSPSAAALPTCCGRDFLVLRQPFEQFARGRVIATYPGANGGQVRFYETEADARNVDYLVFSFGAWTVAVYDYKGPGRMTDEQRAAWAASLSGREVEGGFLVVDADPPLAFSAPGQGTAGPSLRFEDARRMVSISFTPCSSDQAAAPIGGNGGFSATRCLAGGQVRMQAQANEPGFVTAAGTIEVRNLKRR